MNKVLAGLAIAFAAMLFGLGLAAPAQAYPDVPPAGHTSQVPPKVENTPSQAAASAPSSSSLPSTGGPNEWLLAGGVVLVLAGTGTLVARRHRRTA
jgi:LPXTG-motif cell wall-anchored protein